MSGEQDFDLQAAWLRRLTADVEGNLAAFALRIKEAMPECVTLDERRGLFGGARKIIGVVLDLGESRYSLRLERGRLKADISLVVRGIALSTKAVDPAQWFERLTEETRKASEHARVLSDSLHSFMRS